jgi:lipid A 3-O-deacylase
VWNIGITPLFSYALSTKSDLTPYLEFGIGAQYISATEIGTAKKSTHFQFGSIWGLGVKIGQQQRLGMGLRYWHLSNLDIETPNNGVDFYSLNISWRYGGT